MAYSVFVSRYNNNSSIIKNSFSKSSSLGMSAYISNQFRVDVDSKKIYQPKKGRDESEVEFTALVLPSAIPKKQLDELVGEKDYPIKRVQDRFIDASDVVGKDNILIQDAEIISHFWSLNDKNIKDIKDQSLSLKKSNTDLRLYYLYLFTSPIAHKHFPKEMGITVNDLRKIEEVAIHTMCEEVFLSKGIPVELGRHQNKENMVHYHIQTPARVLNYVYHEKEIEFNHSDFKAWLSKEIIYKKRLSKERQEKKKNIWLSKSKADPSEYNTSRYSSWLKKFEKSKEELEELIDIIAGIKISGFTYLEYSTKYKEHLAKRIQVETSSDSLFAKTKGTSELYLDTYAAVDQIKERYAEILNKLLIKEGILKPGSQLYTYVKSTREFVTIREARNWNISEQKRVEVNAKLKKIWKMDIDFYNKPLKYKEKKQMIKRQRLIVHGLKVIMKQSLARYKKEIATVPKKADIFVKFWVNKLETIKANYQDFISSLIDRSIFNYNWKKIVTSEVKFEENKVLAIPTKLKEFEVIHQDELDSSVYHYPEEINEQTIEELNDEIRAIMDQEYVELELEHKNSLERLNYKPNLSEMVISIDIYKEQKTMNYVIFQEIMNAIKNQKEESFMEYLESYYNMMRLKNKNQNPLVQLDDSVTLERTKEKNHLQVLFEKKYPSRNIMEQIGSGYVSNDTKARLEEFFLQIPTAQQLLLYAEDVSFFELIYGDVVIKKENEHSKSLESEIDEALLKHIQNKMETKRAKENKVKTVVEKDDYEIER